MASAAPATEPTSPARAERLGVLLLLAALLLLPIGRSAELAIALGALLGVLLLIGRRIQWSAAAPRLALVVFAGYWLPELLSALDALQSRRAWYEVLIDLRYLPFLLFACWALRGDDAQRLALRGVACIAAFWLLDALIQAVSGYSLGGPASADRLSGIFGADDLKLGGVMALLSPFLLLPAFARHRALGALTLVAVLIVVLLAGARASWVSLALVLAVVLWRAAGGGRRGLLATLLAAAVCGAIALAASQVSDTFAARIACSAAALQGDDGLDHALSGRLPIWQTALDMSAAHPFNGVGVRGFRDAYPAYAADDDPWRGFDGDAGAFHAHQLVLEILAETGALGLLCWLSAAVLALRQLRAAEAQRRLRALPVSLALLAMLFPLNTHYAFYSSAWGGLLMFLLALWLPIIAPSTVSRQAADRADGA